MADSREQRATCRRAAVAATVETPQQPDYAAMQAEIEAFDFEDAWRTSAEWIERLMAIIKKHVGAGETTQPASEPCEHKRLNCGELLRGKKCLVCQNAELRQKLEQAERERDRLKQALRKYGSHRDGCLSRADCYCGWGETAAALREGEPHA